MFSYQHHIGDFNKATRHLTRVERSIYRDMLDLYYETEKPLPGDIKAICRLVIARDNEESTAVEQVLNEFFHKNCDGWAHVRCELEIEKYRNNSNQKSEAGKASAAARAAKRQQIINGRSTDVGTADERDSNVESTNQEPKPSTLNQEPIKKDITPQAGDGLLDDLDESTTEKQKKATPVKFKPESLAETMPTELADWWIKWIEYRRARKLSTKEPTWRAQANNLMNWGMDGHDPCRAIKASIENGWQGLFEPKQPIIGNQLNGSAAKLNFTPADYDNGINPDGSF